MSVLRIFQCLLGFILEGESEKNDHEFPFLRIIELFECSLTLWTYIYKEEGHL